MISFQIGSGNMIHENAGKSKCLMRKMICAGSMVNGWRLEMISAGIHHTGACASVFSAGARRFVCISGARGNAGSPVPPVHGECRFVCTSGARGKFHLIRRKQFSRKIVFATFPCIGEGFGACRMCPMRTKAMCLCAVMKSAVSKNRPVFCTGRFLIRSGSRGRGYTSN